MLALRYYFDSRLPPRPFSLDHIICPLKHTDWNCQAHLFCRLKVDIEFKLRCLLHRQITRFGTFQDLVHVNRRPVSIHLSLDT